MKALILIDLQNEFLDAERGHYPYLIPDSSKIPLIENIRNLVPAFRSHGRTKRTEQEGEIQAQSDNLVVWVRAEYSRPNHSSSSDDQGTEHAGGLQDGDQDGDEDSPIPYITATGSARGNNHFLTGTHAGKTPCCPPGSEAAQIYSAINPLIDADRDLVLTKTWFSAFKETGLAEILRSRAVDEVYFAGLMSNVCVLASVTDSIRLGAAHWKTHVVVDCLGYLREKSHAAALAKLSALTLTVPNEPDATASVVSAPLITSTFFHPHPTLYYVNGSIPSWRVQIALHHKQLPTNDVRMYVMRTPKPTRSPAFLAINPRGKTPVFVDKDPARTRTYESLAILLYLEEYYPGTASSASAGCNSNPSSPTTPLLPPRDDRQKRARVLCLMQESENLHSAYDALEDAYWAAKTPEQAADPSPPKATKPTPTSSKLEDFLTNQRPMLIQAIHAELALWEMHITAAHAAGSRFLAGTDTLSLADCAFYPILSYMVHRGFDFTERFKGLERYYGDMTGLECVQRARPEGWGDGKRRGKTDAFGGR
ncbi:hypothetical protein GX51_06961 [Blastomyces parvus]|uniref:Isochorismatase-like domain-containing protein n=1 Tax=Blastomyces parvus TaxID=2060905 RepID=A0A2B7WFJ3_9EURO|nr:hypothetical protein GX51_06961 [Blastomyces parvus]